MYSKNRCIPIYIVAPPFVLGWLRPCLYNVCLPTHVAILYRVVRVSKLWSLIDFCLGNGNHVHHHQSSSIQNFPNNSISNHHRSNVYTIHNSSSSSANTNSSNTAASSVNHQHRIWHNSTSTSGSTPISGSSSTSASTKPFNNLIDNTLLSNSLANPSPSSMTTTMSSSNTNPNTSVITATAISQSSNCDDGPVNKVIPLIRDFVSMVDDREWLNSLYTLLQNQTYNQCEVDLFELMCKVLDQNLFSQVDWARNSVFFKDLKVSHLFYFTMSHLKSRYFSCRVISRLAEPIGL